MTSKTRADNTAWNPSYPQREHLHERGKWLGVLEEWRARVAEAARQLPLKPDAEQAGRVLSQMQGACDQIADAAARLPMEVGDLYQEDHHRLEQAVGALERLFDKS